MKCPVDKNDMIVVEHKKIELDYCLQCSGVWFDHGELDLFLEIASSIGAKAGIDLIPQEKAKVTEAKRKCPACGSKMDKVWMGKSPKVLIDSCPLGDGLWFDGGELYQVLRQLEPDQKASHNIIAFLGEAFQADHQREKRS